MKTMPRLAQSMLRALLALNSTTATVTAKTMTTGMRMGERREAELVAVPLFCARKALKREKTRTGPNIPPSMVSLAHFMSLNSVI
jgi:hypothetical protein